jgi:hypothetical protein
MGSETSKDGRDEEEQLEHINEQQLIQEAKRAVKQKLEE